MTLQAPQNPDIPSSWKVPGVYVAFDLNGSGAGLSDIRKRLLLVGYKTTDGIHPVDTPVQITGQSQANTYFGRGSDLARQFAAAQSQNGAGAIDIFCLAITPPAGGTASTHLITFIGTATSAHAVTVTICGYKTTVPIASGDSATAIGAAVSAAINLMKDIPVTAGAGSGTVTLTYRVKGAEGNDLPVMVEFSEDAGVKASPGTITYATNASGSGSATVTVGSVTMTASIANLDTPSTVAAAMAAAINGGGNPVTAEAAVGVLTLYYAPGRVVHRISAAIVTSTGITATAAVGTAGSGSPTLTTGLSNLARASAYKCWAPQFNDTTSLGTIATHIETYADGRAQKDQQVFSCSTQTLATAGAIPTGTTPALTASPRYAVATCPDSPQQAYELSARYAAAICASDYAPENFDGVQIRSKTDTVPLLLPHDAVRLSPEEANAAIGSYYLTPLVVDEASSTLQIMTARTTSNDADQRLHEVSVMMTLAYYRYDMNQFLRTRFRRKTYKAAGTPRTTNCITDDNVKDAMYERVVLWDDADLFDGAESIRDQIRVNVDPVVRTRINTFLPCKPPLPVHQISVVAGLV